MNQKDKRAARNAELVARMKQGENLCGVDVMESWFPVRPVIKKDPELIRKALEKDDSDK